MFMWGLLVVTAGHRSALTCSVQAGLGLGMVVLIAERLALPVGLLCATSYGMCHDAGILVWLPFVALSATPFFSGAEWPKQCSVPCLYLSGFHNV